MGIKYTWLYIKPLDSKQLDQAFMGGGGDVRFANRPTTAILQKSETAEILTTEKSRDRNPVIRK